MSELHDLHALLIKAQASLQTANKNHDNSLIEFYLSEIEEIQDRIEKCEQG